MKRPLDIANAITIGRLVLAPFFCVWCAWALKQELSARALAAAAFAGIVLSDALDGAIARRVRGPSPLGTALDLCADAALVAGSHATLALVGAAPAWLPLLTAAKLAEFIWTSRRRGRGFFHDFLGRTAVAFFYAIVPAALLAPALARPCAFAALALSAVSTFFRVRRALAQESPTPEPILNDVSIASISQSPSQFDMMDTSRPA